jgi:hypothetical protein
VDGTHAQEWALGWRNSAGVVDIEPTATVPSFGVWRVGGDEVLRAALIPMPNAMKVNLQ